MLHFRALPIHKIHNRFTPSKAIHSTIASRESKLNFFTISREVNSFCLHKWYWNLAFNCWCCFFSSVFLNVEIFWLLLLSFDPMNSRYSRCPRNNNELAKKSRRKKDRWIERIERKNEINLFSEEENEYRNRKAQNTETAHKMTCEMNNLMYVFKFRNRDPCSVPELPFRSLPFPLPLLL